MSKWMPRGRVEHLLCGDFTVPIPDVLQVTFHATDDFPREVHSVCRVPGETDVVFIGRAQDVAHEHWMRHACGRAVFIQCVYHLPSDPELLQDALLNHMSVLRHRAEDLRIPLLARLDASIELMCFHGDVPSGLLN